MTTEIRGHAELFDDLDRTLQESGPSAAVDRLVSAMEGRGDPHSLLDALLLKARHDLGLPSVQSSTLAEIPEPQRSQYEEKYVEAIRHVGKKLLDEGAIARAWPYYRAIGEKEPVVAALEGHESIAGESPEDLIDVAFNQGAHPVKGYAWILEHHGICNAITAFDSLPPDEAIRLACAEKLIKSLHDQLAHSLREDIRRRGLPAPAEGTSITDLVEAHAWLFEDDAYHIDTSHLAAVTRLAPMVSSPEILSKAVELTDYGKRLSEKYRHEGDPPFDDFYGDHGVFLRAMMGRDVDAAIAHFREKLPAVDPDGDGDIVPAQVLVRLLVHLKRFEEAISVSAEQLAGVPETSLGVPGISVLCERAGRRDRLAEVARAQGDPVRYAAAILPR